MENKGSKRSMAILRVDNTTGCSRKRGSNMFRGIKSFGRGIFSTDSTAIPCIIAFVGIALTFYTVYSDLMRLYGER